MGTRPAIGLDSRRGESKLCLTHCRILEKTESSSAEVGRPEFGILFARLRDRISTLRPLYGGGPLGD